MAAATIAMPAQVPVYSGISSPNHLKHCILNEFKTPVVFKDKIKPWFTSLSWTPGGVCDGLGETSTTIKLCPRNSSLLNEVIFETDCKHVSISFKDIKEWLCNNEEAPEGEEPKVKRSKCINHDRDHDNHDTHEDKLSVMYPRNEYWIYADYKYMSQLCAGHQHMIECIDWSMFGFSGRNGNQSTLWLGSDGAQTPCHYDTYGCNLVAQLSGTKRWTLFPPSDTDKLYPTRVPYEESSVFSSVNIRNPNLQNYPLYKNAASHQVILEPGDVLFVPFHWWHYVECLEPAVSVNTWIDLPLDSNERVKEAIVRTLVSSLITEELEVNPNEVIFPHHQNVSLLNEVLQHHNNCNSSGSTTVPKQLTNRDFINIITSDQVLRAIQDTIACRQ